MKTLNVFDVLFTNKKSEKYTSAIDTLSRVDDIISNISMTIPDISSREIEVIKNQWVDLNHPIGEGVHVMGLHLEDDFRSLLVHYQADGHIAQHFHSKEYETILILDGSCEDISTGTQLVKDDLYIIPKNAIHHIVAKEECYMYVTFSTNQKLLKIGEDEKKKARSRIGKHSFKAK